MDLDMDLDGDATDTCLCEAGELCAACMPEGLETMIQLKLSLPWARESALVRQLVSAEAYLRHSSRNN